MVLLKTYCNLVGLIGGACTRGGSERERIRFGRYHRLSHVSLGIFEGDIMEMFVGGRL